MSGPAELRLIKKITANKPFMKVSRVLNVLGHARRVVRKRRSEQNTLKLEAEIRRCEIEKCLKILNDM